MHTAIAGTAKLANPRGNLTTARRGPLEIEDLESIDRAWHAAGSGWAAST